MTSLKSLQDPWLAPLTTSGSLRSSARRGIIVLMLGQGGKLVAQAGGTIALARILTPQDFGLIAMAATVSAFIVLFKDAGLATATAQQHNITHDQVSTLFWLNIIVGACLAAVMALIAPVVAFFYDQPTLTDIITVLGLGLLFGGLSAQHDALLRRRLLFGRIMIAEVTALTISFVVAIFLGLSGWGWWALVAQKVLQLALSAVLLLIFCPWRPTLVFRWNSVRSQFAFGMHISAFNFVNFFGRNGDNVLIGWYWGAGPVGVYTKSYDLLLGPLSQIAAPLGGLLIPLLGRLRNEPERYKKTFNQALLPANLCLVPVAAIMLVMPDVVTAILLGAQWTGAAAVIMWFGPALATQLILSSAGWVLISQGRGADYAKVGAFSSVCFLVSFAVAVPWGIDAVAAAYVACCSVVVMPAVFWFTGRQGPIKAWDFLGHLVLTVWCGIFVVIGQILLSFVTMPSFLHLGTGLVAGYAIIPLALFVLPQGRAILRNTAKAFFSKDRPL